MIKRSLIVFLILAVLYTFFVWLMPPYGRAQHQNQQNIVLAQKYMYKTNRYRATVMVGSSLATRVVTDSLPGVFNLSFGGLSVFDGLYIVQHSPGLPRRILIETNTLLRGSSNDFLHALFHPVSFFARKHIPSLREEMQPLPNAIGYITEAIVNLRSASTAIRPSKPLNTAVFNTMLADKRMEYEGSIDTVLLAAQLSELLKHVEWFKAREVEIIFFELPINHSLTNLPVPVALRSAIRQYFMHTGVQFVSLPDTPYTSSDGIHLPKEEALAYTLWLRERMRNW